METETKKNYILHTDCLQPRKKKGFHSTLVMLLI